MRMMTTIIIIREAPVLSSASSNKQPLHGLCSLVLYSFILTAHCCLKQNNPKGKGEVWLMSLQTASTDNLHIRNRTVVRVCRNMTEMVNRCHSFTNTTKDGVLSIQPRSRSQRYEKLTAVCIWARVGLQIILPFHSLPWREYQHL